LEIQVRQIDEGELRKKQEERDREEEIREISRQWQLEKDQVYILQRQLKEQESQYKDKLMRFARELEGVSIRKSKNKEKLYQAGLQIKSVLNNLIDLIRGHIHTKKETLSLKSLKPLLETLHDKCDILE